MHHFGYKTDQTTKKKTYNFRLNYPLVWRLFSVPCGVKGKNGILTNAEVITYFALWFQKNLPKQTHPDRGGYLFGCFYFRSDKALFTPAGNVIGNKWETRPP